MLNLYKNARPDERFHVAHCNPFFDAWGFDWLYRSVKWQGMPLPDGAPGYFNSYILLWCIRWYRGSVKVDGTRTLMLENGQLGASAEDWAGWWVLTTTLKEMFSFRLRWHKPNREVVTNMGGI